MADLSITASAVLAGTNGRIKHGTAGATITAGQALYQNATTKKWLLADADSGTAAARTAHAIALNGASDGQPVSVLEGGDLTLNAVLTAGTAYYLSGAPGGICPLADLGSGDYVCLIGLAKSTTVLAVDFQAPGVAL